MSNPRNALSSVLDVLGVAGGTVYSHAFHGTGASKTSKGSRVPTALCGLLIAVVALLALTAPALAALPDNRTYEMVSPVDKGGASYLANLAVADASGERVIVDGGPANSLLSHGFSWMLESRTATGWNGVQVGPPPVPGASYISQRETKLVAVSQDVSSVAFSMFMGLDPRDGNSPPGVRTETIFGLPAEDVPSTDVYVRRGPAEPFTWASGPPAPIVKTAELPQPECFTEPFYCALNGAVFAGGSSDLSTIVWSQFDPLVAPPASLPGSPADTHQHGNEVYSSTNGAGQRLVGLVPASGSECGPGPGGCVVPSCGAAMGNASRTGWVEAHSFAPTAGAVSGDGSQVLFTSPEPAVEGEPGCHPGEIYLREGATSTVQVSASQRTVPDPHGPQAKLYAGAAQEGERIDTVFFTASEELTNNANTGSADEGKDLYAYSLATGKLTDLTPENNTPEPQRCGEEEICPVVEVKFVGSSTSGQLVYFTATSVLAAEPNSQGEKAHGGASNLYVYDANTGTTRFVAPGNGIEGVRSAQKAAGVDESVGGRLTSQVTPDGRHLVFRSSEHITSDDKLSLACPTRDEEGKPTGPGQCAEVYLYDEPGNTVVCVSCDPSGAPPTASAELPAASEVGTGPGYVRSDPWTAPAPRFVSDNGERVFFNSPDQLTLDAPPPSPPKAKPGTIRGSGPFEFNAYEYENGHVNLIAPAATISTVTPSGNDVFFYSYAQLVPQDRDGTVDIYDARVGGGFPALAAPVCSGTSCQGAPAPAPIFAVPPSATFNGVGNFPLPPATKQVPKSKPKAKPKACKRGFVKKKTKCVRKPKSKKAAKSNRRGH
jgi:hypothetical protein